MRRLDAGVALARRSEQEMIPLKTAQDAVTFVSEWLLHDSPWSQISLTHPGFPV